MSTGQQQLGREMQLLLRCICAQSDPAELSEVATPPVDWTEFLTLAERHNVTSLCCRRLEQVCPEAVPGDVLEILRRQLRQEAKRNLFLTGELLRILDCLAAGGVNALAVKGPVLAWWLYRHPALRRFLDLDILVGKPDVERATQHLTTLGFSIEGGSDNLTPKLLPSAHEISLSRPASGVAIDLHWDLMPPEMGLAFDARHLLPRATTLLVAGRSVPTLGFEDQILYCVLHAGKHGWTNLGWLADFSAMVNVYPPDWARLLAEARRKHVSRALFVGVRLLHDLMGVPVPAQISKPLERDRASGAIARKTCRFLVNQPVERFIFPREVGYQLALAEGCSRKINYLWRKVTMPSTQDAELSPHTRPLRLMSKYVCRLAGLEPSARTGI